jgi:hypothetical protein
MEGEIRSVWKTVLKLQIYGENSVHSLRESTVQCISYCKINTEKNTEHNLPVLSPPHLCILKSPTTKLIQKIYGA